MFKRMAFSERLTKDQRIMFKVTAGDMIRDSLRNLRDDINIDYKPLIQDHNLKESDIVNPKFIQKLTSLNKEHEADQSKKVKPRKKAKTTGSTIANQIKSIFSTPPNERKKRIGELKRLKGMK